MSEHIEMIVGSGSTSRQKGDSVSLPTEIYEKMLSSSSDTIYTVKITNLLTDGYVYGKVGESHQRSSTILMPKWMKNVLSVRPYHLVQIEHVQLPKIKKVIFKISETVDDITSVLEYELMNTSVLYIGKQIEVKIFDVCIQIEVINIFNRSMISINCGIVTFDDIEFDIL